MRKLTTVGLVLIMLILVCVAIPMNASAASITKITPDKGKAGRTTIIHGVELEGNTVHVRFGQSEMVMGELLNFKTIKVTVPEKNPTDPEEVPVFVWIDKRPVPGIIWFEYIGAK
ncbi:MAG: IPT/TIG domain-containing protein [Thermoplasmata archaeon]|nr:MAG: IPT/TIG domain-containing protein [Thermoplasmata archaeon]